VRRIKPPAAVRGVGTTAAGTLETLMLSKYASPSDPTSTNPIHGHDANVRIKGDIAENAPQLLG
jgi:hypothetical protein